MRFPATVAAVLALAALAAPASGSTAKLVDVPIPPECKFPPPSGVCPPLIVTALVYEAEAGEANVVSVEPASEGVRVSDPGAVIEAGQGCESVDQHTVDCGAPQRVFVDAGDGDDTVRTGGVVDGGPGDDLVVGGPLGDVLYAGAGADVLRGGGGPDRLHDTSPRDRFRSSDLSPYFVESSPTDATSIPLTGPGRGRDRFDGGPDHDAISYEGRGGGVRVDLARTAAVAGAAREHDSVRNVESALTGTGDDRLAGNRRGNDLNGGAGDDRIAGRRGADRILGGDGRNRIFAGPGDDTIDSSGSDHAVCGSGSDSVNPVLPSDFVNDDREELLFGFLRDGGLFGGSVVSFLPLDADEPPIVLSTDELFCHSPVNPSGCRLTLEVRVNRRGSLLGSQTYEFAPDEKKSVTLELSRAGARFLRRHGPLLVRVRVIEDQAPRPGGYMTVLRAP